LNNEYSTGFDAAVLGLGLALFAVVCVWLYRLMQSRNYMLLLLWPIVIYFCGPTATGLFADAPVLGRYVFADSVAMETLIIFAYFAAFLVADRILNLSGCIRASFENPTIASLARSPLFLPIFIPTALAASALQIQSMRDFGSIFSGQYALTNVAEGLIPYWGFLAGLYEIIFLLFVLFILSGSRSKLRYLVIGLYVVTAALRVAGGTRMILIKEVAVLLILFYARGAIKRRHLIIAGSAVVALGSAVGLLRTTAGAGILGPVYGLVMESGLNALTFNIAYQVQAAGYVAQHGDLLNSLAFVTFSSVPSFLRFGIEQPDLDALSPYTLAISSGFDSSQPVGGMSGFATLCYLSSYPFAATLVLVAMLSFLLKFAPRGVLKHIFIVVFCLDTLHFWRDSIDISVKLLLQDVVCALALLYVPAIRRRPVAVRTPSPDPV
jgi:hypothetical protein